VRVDGPRAAMLTTAAVRLAGAAMPLVAVCAAVGAAVAGGGGAVAGVVVAGLVLAVVGAYCDRLALSATLARPLSEVEHPELYRLVRELSKAGRLPVPRLFLSPAQQPNSFAVGRSPRTASICCTEGLLAALDQAELRGVLGHELAHVSSRDILPATFPAGITRFLPAPVGSPAAAGPAEARGGEAGRGPAGTGLGVLEAWLLLVFGPIAALVIRLSVTREREYRADAAGALLAGDPVALSSALRKIDVGTAELALAPDARLTAVGHLMVASPFRAEGFARLFRTHPPTGERVRRLEALAGYRR
jgi:heat shock protein HtpX